MTFGSPSFSTPPARKLAPPPQAIAAGFTRLDFVSVYNTPSGIDATNGRQAGFTDYLTFAWPNRAGVSSPQNDPWLTFAPQTFSNLSIVNNTTLHSAAGAAVSLNNVASACDNGAGGYVGTALGPGGYWEAKVRFSSTNTFGTGFYMFPAPYFTGTESIPIEIDMLECINNVVAQVNVIEWNMTTNPASNVIHNTVFGIDTSVYSVAGFLWKTKAQSGSSQGGFSFWNNNVAISSFTYSTGTYSQMDTEPYVHFLASQYSMDCEYIAHWST